MREKSYQVVKKNEHEILMDELFQNTELNNNKYKSIFDFNSINEFNSIHKYDNLNRQNDILTQQG
jgi:hypothetical protein